MRIESLDVFRFPAPFKVVFRHASASRAKAANVIVAARGPGGVTGYGEGCPREYVTGETVASAAAFIRMHKAAIVRNVADSGALGAWTDVHREEIDANPAAFCALETAVLDLIGKLESCPIEDLLGVSRLSGSFRYSAVLGDGKLSGYERQAEQYRRMGFRDYKVKLSGDIDRDKRKLAVLSHANSQAVRIRVDANNLWHDPAAVSSYLKRLDADVFAVEEPLQAGDFKGCARIARESGVKIIADESVTRIGQLPAIDDPARWIVNLRVSKMGGLRRSLELAREAVRRGVSLIVGAQVGETSILTRAALTVMNEHRSALLAAEGAFGTLLLERDLSEPCLMFGPGGTLNAESALNPSRPGLGLRIHEALLTPI